LDRVVCSFLQFNCHHYPFQTASELILYDDNANIVARDGDQISPVRIDERNEAANAMNALIHAEHLSKGGTYTLVAAAVENSTGLYRLTLLPYRSDHSEWWMKSLFCGDTAQGTLSEEASMNEWTLQGLIFSRIFVLGRVS
jgi:hypothetical protein